MVAPVKKTTLNVAEKKRIANEIVADIKNDINRQSERGNAECETEIEMYQCGHGSRPFGDASPDAYIDFEIKCCGKKYSGLGRYDVELVGELITSGITSKDLHVEQGEFIRLGNFTPDFKFPCAVRNFVKEEC